jgi:hypothetical protein
MEVDNLFLLDFQVFEVAPSLHMVELRKIGGDTLEFHKVRQHSNLDISKKKKKHPSVLDAFVFEGWKSFNALSLWFANIVCISLIMWQFYKSFSSGLKDVVWKSDQTIEGLR